MAIETFEFIDDLNAANPTPTDNVSEGDDHLRGLKTTLKNTFPNVTGAINATETELNYVDGVTSNIQTQLDNINTDLLNDTTPQLGGSLDLNGNAITGTGAIPSANLSGALPAIDGSSLTNLPGGGKVLQVVSATYSTEVTNATNTLTNTGLTATITPSSTTSKILVIVHQNGAAKSYDNGDNGLYVTLARGGSTINTITTISGMTNSAVTRYLETISTTYLDSPATTSATIYKTQFKNRIAASEVKVQYGGSTSTITLMEIGA